MMIEGSVTGLGVGVVLGGVLAYLLRTWLVKLCKVQLERLYTPLTQSLADADALTAFCRVKVAAEFKEERRNASLPAERKSSERSRRPSASAFASAESRRDEKLAGGSTRYTRRKWSKFRQLRRTMRDAIDGHDRRMAELRNRCPLPVTPSSTKNTRHTRNGSDPPTKRRGTSWRGVARDGMNQAAAELDAVNREVDAYCPDWSDPAWQSRALPKVVPPVIRSGKTPLDLASLPGGISRRADLMEGVPTTFDFPALQAVSPRTPTC